MSADACPCEVLQHLSGAEAQDYERSHLKEVAVDSVRWIALFQCPLTGRWWLHWLPYAEMPGGGPPELTQISRGLALSMFHLPDDTPLRPR